MKQFAIILLFAAILSAQPFGGGIKVGAPLTDAISIASGAATPDTSITTNRYTVGPYVEFRLPGRFAVEIDALYSSFSYSQPSSILIGPSLSAVTVSGSGSNGRWDFPVLAKYKLLPGPVKPYIEGGLLLSHLTGSSFDIAHSSNYGVVLGAGVEIHALVLRISPEIRYDGFFFHDFTSNSFVQSNRNQVMALVGIGF